MLARGAAQQPERVLQPLGEGNEAFAAEDDVRVLESRIDEPEVVEPVVQGGVGDGDAEIAHVGEVRQPRFGRVRGSGGR